jgi:hypothetical protein
MIEAALRFHVDDIQASTHLTADVGKSYTLPQSLFFVDQRQSPNRGGCVHQHACALAEAVAFFICRTQHSDCPRLASSNRYLCSVYITDFVAQLHWIL